MFQRETHDYRDRHNYVYCKSNHCLEKKYELFLLENIHILPQLVRGRKRSVNLMANVDSKLRKGGR